LEAPEILHGNSFVHYMQPSLM